MLETFRKEFVVFVDPEIEELHFGALPAIGRYYTKKCSKMSDGVFRVEIEAPKGFLYYHFYYNNNPLNVVLDATNTQIGAKNWHSICKIGTDVVIPVSFLPQPPYVYAFDEQHYGFKLVASHKWVQEVHLEVCGKGVVIYSCCLPTVFSMGGYSYFEASVQKEDVLCGDHYRFRVIGNDHVYYLGHHGTLLKEPNVFYEVARLAELQPEFVEHNPAVYHIFPDRFARAEVNDNSTVSLEPWGTSPARETFFGGNLKGLIEKLPHLLRLNISEVYLTPIFQANSNHRYDCINYTSIDPLLGSAQDFQAFVDLCHQNGLRVILDIVLNHCGIEFFAFQDLLKNQEHSSYKDWFLVQHFPVKVGTVPPDYRCWWNNAMMPEFNMANPQVREHLLEVLTHWVHKFGIDGWRIDVSSEMDILFLEELRATLKGIREDILIIGENWKDASLFLDGSRALDGTTNYLYWWKGFVPYFVDRRLEVSEFIFAIMEIYFTYSHAKILKSWNVLSSHDIPRFISMLADQADIFPASFLQITLPGTPVVYYGEEIGLEGLDDPFNRGCMPWNIDIESSELFNWYRNLLHAYQTEPALNHGYLAVHAVDDQERLLIHKRYLNGETVFCITNLSHQEKVVDLSTLLTDEAHIFVDLLAHTTHCQQIIVPAKRGCLLK